MKFLNLLRVLALDWVRKCKSILSWITQKSKKNLRLSALSSWVSSNLLKSTGGILGTGGDGTRGKSWIGGFSRYGSSWMVLKNRKLRLKWRKVSWLITKT